MGVAEPKVARNRESRAGRPKLARQQGHSYRRIEAAPHPIKKATAIIAVAFPC